MGGLGVLARAHRARRRSRPRGGGTETAPLAAFLLLAGIVALALLAAPEYLRPFRRELARPESLERAVRELGLDFARADPAYPGVTASRYPFELFARGTRQECESVFGGAVDGVRLTGFDFAYFEEPDAPEARVDPAARVDAVPRRVTCVIAELEASFPHVVITPVGLVGGALDEATWATWGVRNRAIQFESRAFDRAFEVRSEDPRFASALIDPAMMAWLLARGARWQWELQRAYVLCTRGLVPPQQVGDMIATLVAFTRQISAAARSF